MEPGRLVGFVTMGALIVALVLLIRAAGCPDLRTMVSPAEVAFALDRRHLAAVEVPDAPAKLRGVTILRSTVGVTGIVAAVGMGETRSLLTDDPRWVRRLTPGYERDELNVVFYALRGGSEADRARVRAAISHTGGSLDPSRPRRCQDE